MATLFARRIDAPCTGPRRKEAAWKEKVELWLKGGLEEQRGRGWAAPLARSHHWQ